MPYGILGQPIELEQNALTAHFEHLGQARLDQRGLAALIADDALALPPVHEQADGVGVEVDALFGQRAPAPGVEAGHEGEQQRALGQGIEPVGGKDGALEQLGAALGVVGIPVAGAGHVGVPAVHERGDLRAIEGFQHRLGEARQPPLLLLVGVGAAGDQDVTALEGVGEIGHDLLDLRAPLVGFGHLVQPVEDHQAAVGQEVLAQQRGVVGQITGCQFLADEAQHIFGARGGVSRAGPRAAKSRRMMRTGSSGPWRQGWGSGSFLRWRCSSSWGSGAVKSARLAGLSPSSSPARQSVAKLTKVVLPLPGSPSRTSRWARSSWATAEERRVRASSSAAISSARLAVPRWASTSGVWVSRAV